MLADHEQRMRTDADFVLLIAEQYEGSGDA